jgi:tetratricopeptide (TPR) repeat protein
MSRGDAKSYRTAALLLLATFLLTLNGAYLAAFATPDLFYVLNSLFHALLGLVATVLFAIFILQHRKAFRDTAGAILVLLAAVAFGSGAYLAVVGMTSRDPRVLDVHVAFALAALFAAVVFLRRGRWATASLAGNSSLKVRKLWGWSVVALLACAAFYGGVRMDHHFFPNPYYIISNPKAAPLTMAQEGGGSHSLVWPSSAQTANSNPIPTHFFLSSKSCEPCHPTIYHEWYSSMHHFASFNNQWYRKAIEYMQDTVGIRPSLWCGGCHDQAISFTGAMEKYPIRDIENTAAGQAGLGCVSCHGIVHVHSTMGQADFTMLYPPLDKYAESTDPVIRLLHYYVVKLDPKSHVSVFFKPFLQNRQEEALFCSACHKVHLDVPVNHYRWIRGFDEYDNWQASGTDWQGARSFYYPPSPKTCIDCHMPLVRSNDFGNIDGYVHSHRFAAAETAVPTSYGDWKQVAAVEHFLKGALSVDIFALAEEPQAHRSGAAVATPAGNLAGGPQLATTYAQGEESSSGGVALHAATESMPAKLMAPVGRVRAVLHRGQTVRVEVVVRTLKLGHFFPGGTVDAYDCWLELKATDNKGHIIFWSGEAADHGRGPVDPGAHFYRSLQLDAHRHAINKRNAWATRAVVYTRLIPPGAADTVHYRLRIPPDCGDRITLTAKLNYRKFSWWFTQWAFAGVHDPAQRDPAVTPDYDDTRWAFTGNLSGVSAKYKRIPNVPIVVIARQSVTLPVTSSGRNGAAIPFTPEIALNRADLFRWNDYGIGLLLQGDFKGAERAFDVVTRIDANYADGWVNVARALIQEGNTDAAKPLLLKALKLDPRLGSAHYFYGLALKADGNYKTAYHQFALAAARYPNDRVVRNQMGEMLFLQRKYGQALDEFQRVLNIDPEDLFAHYNMMLCYMGLGKPSLAGREERMYLRFKANEIARAITGPYRLTHPDDNEESLPVHEHLSIPLDEINHAPAFWYSPYLPQNTPEPPMIRARSPAATLSKKGLRTLARISH